MSDETKPWTKGSAEEKAQVLWQSHATRAEISEALTAHAAEAERVARAEEGEAFAVVQRQRDDARAQIAVLFKERAEDVSIRREALAVRDDMEKQLDTARAALAVAERERGWFLEAAACGHPNRYESETEEGGSCCALCVGEVARRECDRVAAMVGGRVTVAERERDEARAGEAEAQRALVDVEHAHGRMHDELGEAQENLRALITLERAASADRDRLLASAERLRDEARADVVARLRGASDRADAYQRANEDVRIEVEKVRRRLFDSEQAGTAARASLASVSADRDRLRGALEAISVSLTRNPITLRDMAFAALSPAAPVAGREEAECPECDGCGWVTIAPTSPGGGAETADCPRGCAVPPDTDGNELKRLRTALKMWCAKTGSNRRPEQADTYESGISSARARIAAILEFSALCGLDGCSVEGFHARGPACGVTSLVLEMPGAAMRAAPALVAGGEEPMCGKCDGSGVRTEHALYGGNAPVRVRCECAPFLAPHPTPPEPATGERFWIAPFPVEPATPPPSVTPERRAELKAKAIEAGDGVAVSPPLRVRAPPPLSLEEIADALRAGARGVPGVSVDCRVVETAPPEPAGVDRAWPGRCESHTKEGHRCRKDKGHGYAHSCTVDFLWSEERTAPPDPVMMKAEKCQTCDGCGWMQRQGGQTPIRCEAHGCAGGWVVTPLLTERVDGLEAGADELLGRLSAVDKGLSIRLAALTERVEALEKGGCPCGRPICSGCGATDSADATLHRLAALEHAQTDWLAKSLDRDAQATRRIEALEAGVGPLPALVNVIAGNVTKIAALEADRDAHAECLRMVEVGLYEVAQAILRSTSDEAARVLVGVTLGRIARHPAPPVSK